MSTKKVIGGSVAAIVILIIAQLAAQLAASALNLIKIPDGICNIIAGIFYVGLTYVILKIYIEKVIRLPISDFGMPVFHIKRKWILIAILLPLLVKGSYLLFFQGAYVSSHMNGKIKREKGEFIGAFAPYGYCKDPENKNCLVIDDYAADIVRKIFAWKIEGFSFGAIAEKLNVRHVQSPKEYKIANGENYNAGFQGTDTPKWSAVQIKRILTNEVYIGNMVQGKQERISYKVKKRLDKPESEWVRVKNTHPAIINQSDFDVVQKLLQYDGRASKTSDSASFFAGFIFCGDCGVPMIRRVNRYKGKEKAFYICQTKNKGGDCTRHSIPEEVLKKIVLKEIQMYTALFVDYEMIMEELQQMEVSYDQVISYDTQIAKLQEEYNKCYSIKVSLADDLKSGMITKEEFDEFRESYGKKCEELDQMIEHQKKLVKQMFEGGVSAKVQLEDWKKSLEIKELDRTLLALTVDKIYIYENKQIKIRIRYQDVIEKMKVIKRFYTEHQAEYRKEVG